MTLAFPNPSRSFDEVRNAVRFIGHDGMFEVPFFIDADAEPGFPGWPRGGMTVVKFRDPHLSYALTWFGMALLTLVAVGVLVASERRLRDDRRRHSSRGTHVLPPG